MLGGWLCASKVLGLTNPMKLIKGSHDLVDIIHAGPVEEGMEEDELVLGVEI